MANINSAKKADRAAKRRRIFNTRRKKAMKDAIKELSSLFHAKKIAQASSQLPVLYQAVDKAAKRGIIKSNTAARIKSHITKRISTIAT